MTFDSAEWFYLIVDQRQGPVDSDALERLLASGSLPPETLVWAAGMPGWEPASLAFRSSASNLDRRLASQASWSLGLGIVSIVGLIVFITLPAAIAGLVLGIKALKSSRRGQAIAGIVLSSLSLLVLVWLDASLGRAILEVGSDKFIVELLGAIQ